jgi:hypothetical protein
MGGISEDANTAVQISFGLATIPVTGAFQSQCTAILAKRTGEPLRDVN